MSNDTPHSDPVEEALRLIAAADEESLRIRAVGGVAFTLQATNRRPRLARRLKDVDVVVPKGSSKQVAALLARVGYTADEMFNALRGATRMLFYDLTHERHLDVFVGHFSLCHDIPVAERLDRDDLTIPREELLLTKLQIVQLTENDRIDVTNLLVEHPVLESTQPQGVDASFIARQTGADWGLWRTSTMNLDRLGEFAESAPLTPEERRRVLDGLTTLKRAINEYPKSTKWRLRSRVGDKVKWYNEPTEE